MAMATENSVTGLFDQAVSAFGDAMKAGVRVQEEMTRIWTDVLEQAKPAQGWQKRGSAMINDAIPAAQKNGEEWLRLVEQNYRRSLDLLRKAFASGEPDGAELQAKTQELWEASLAVARDNAQAMAHANVRMMEMWADVLKRGANGAAREAMGATREAMNAAERAAASVTRAAKEASKA